MNYLPHRDKAFVDREKIVQYLLDTTRMPGAAKARFFLSFGFSIEAWEDFAGALLAHGRNSPMIDVSQNAYGSKYVLEGPLVTPDGRSPFIRSVWFCGTDRLAPRLITAYPVDV